MKKLFLTGIFLFLAAHVFAQGTKGALYFNKELSKWVFQMNTDSSDVRREGRLCAGDGAPFGQSATSGDVPTVALSATNRLMYYRVQATGGAATTVNGMITLDYRFLFTDQLKYWFGNRSLANDTCIFFVSGRTTGAGTVRCSLFVYNYGSALTDTLFRCAMPTTNTGGTPDTAIVTFESACKDSNSYWPLKFPNGYFMPCLFYQLKIATSVSGGSYDIYNFRILTDWRNH